MTAVVFRESSREVVLHSSVGPLGPTILALAPYIISDLDGYTVQQLGEVPAALILRDAGGERVLYVGMPSFGNIIEELAGYTILTLDMLISALDDL